MAVARVGTGVTASGSGPSTLDSPAKNVTTGNFLVAIIKWETTAITLTGVTDTALNTWVIDQQVQHTAGEPKVALAYALNITGNAANVVKATWGAGCTFQVICVEEFSGVATASAKDSSSTNAEGSSTSYSTGNIITTQAGLVICGVGGYTGQTFTAAGTPAFTLGIVGSDTMIEYLISGSGQTVSPAATGTASNRWVCLATAFKDTGGGGGGGATRQSAKAWRVGNWIR